MIFYREELVPVHTVEAITCDACKVRHDDPYEIQEFLQWENDAGYGSVFGDGERLRLDLCQRCALELLGPFIRRVGNYISDRRVPNEVTRAAMQEAREKL